MALRLWLIKDLTEDPMQLTHLRMVAGAVVALVVLAGQRLILLEEMVDWRSFLQLADQPFTTLAAGAVQHLKLRLQAD
jgi:hypothetical protein